MRFTLRELMSHGHTSNRSLAPSPHDANGHTLNTESGTDCRAVNQSRQSQLSTSGIEGETRRTPPVPSSCSCEKPVAENAGFASYPACCSRAQDQAEYSQLCNDGERYGAFCTDVVTRICVHSDLHHPMREGNTYTSQRALSTPKHRAYIHPAAQESVYAPGNACPLLVVPINKSTTLAGSGMGTSALLPNQFFSLRSSTRWAYWWAWRACACDEGCAELDGWAEFELASVARPARATRAVAGRSIPNVRMMMACSTSSEGGSDGEEPLSSRASVLLIPARTR